MKKQVLQPMALSVFCENMAMMTAAGIPNDEAVGLLSGEGDALFTQAMEALQQELAEPGGLARAAQACGYFPPYACQMLEAGETTGSLEQVLYGLAEHYREQDAFAHALRDALAYPLGLLVLMTAILALLVAKVLPVFELVYQNLAGGVSTSGYTWAGRLISGFALAATALLAAALLAALAASRLEKGKAALQWLAQRLPVAAPLSQTLALARLVRVLALFSASGMDEDSALAAAIPLAGDRTVQQRAKACQAQMDQGKGLANAFYQSRLLPPLYGRMLLSGAKSGCQQETLERLAKRLAQEGAEGLAGAVAAVEPVLSGFLTVAVGAVLLSVMLPLVAILGSIA